METPAKIHISFLIDHFRIESEIRVSITYESNECYAKRICEMEVVLLGLYDQGINGKQVAVEEKGNGIWKVFYRNVFLGYFNEKDIREKKETTRLSTNCV